MENKPCVRVLSVSTSDTRGGAARAAYRIHQGVRELGVDSRMLVKEKMSGDAFIHALSEYVPNNILYNAFDWIATKAKNQIQHYHWHKYPNRDHSFISDLRSTRIHDALISWDYDLLHLHWINQRFLSIDELKKVHKPIIWTLHDSWPFCGICHVPLDCTLYMTHCGRCPQLHSAKERDMSYSIFEKKLSAYKELDLHIVTPSRWLAGCAKQSRLLEQFHITVIPNGLDTELFRIIRKKDNSASSEKPIIIYGAVNAAKDIIKGFKTLLTALRILDSQGFKANLMVFGADTHALPMQFKHIDVTFLGYITDNRKLAGLYSMADVMVVPSFSEVFGQTASEAMACGTPVVAFRCTGIQEVVEEGCGYLAKPYSEEDLANGIRYCIEHNPDNIMGKAARESAVKRFSINVVARQYVDLYQSLLGEASLK